MFSSDFFSILCPKHLCIISIAFLQIFILFLYSVFIFFEFCFIFFVVVQINSNEKNGILIIFCVVCFVGLSIYFIRIMTIKFENRIKDSKRQEPHVDLQEGRKAEAESILYLYFLYIFKQCSTIVCRLLFKFNFFLYFLVYFFVFSYYFLSPDTL